ncbi:hypothetical protein BJY04DRAFT_214664 [Aspergillus karnatakaensis]|uniref:uncharacterized protein n=1 Tax=Aspergillus karnatakaensis TaxID=1810916 RepID=UPI003CCD219C
MHLPTLSLAVFTLFTAAISANPILTPNLEPEPYHPELIGKPHGVDIGNQLCTGACVADPGLLICEHVEFRPKYGCYMCCISDDDLDHLDEKITPLDDDKEED